MSRAEEIMVAVKDRVTGLTVTGSNVKRDREYPLEGSVTSALSVYQGNDLPIEDEAQPWPWQDMRLDVYIDLQVKDSATPVSTLLNAIYDEVGSALMTNIGNPLGLSFVQDIKEFGRGEPELNNDGEKPVAQQRASYSVRYRRNIENPAL